MHNNVQLWLSKKDVKAKFQNDCKEKSECLDDGSILLLIDSLINFVKTNRKLIELKVSEMILHGLNTNFIEFSDEYLLLLNKKANDKEVIDFHIGFPFPIYNHDFQINEILMIPGFDAHFYLRGKNLRMLQRAYFKKKLSQKYKKVIWIEQSRDEFGKISDEICKNVEKCLYIDPHNYAGGTHLGDSFITLQIPESFRKRYSFKKMEIVSNSYEHLQFFYETYNKKDFSYEDKINDFDLIIAPDLLDDRWNETINISFVCLNKNKPVFIIGRNLILNKVDDNVYAYHCNIDDPILIRKGVDHYYNDCIEPYNVSEQEVLEYHPRKLVNGILNIYINPFSSSPLRDIPVNLILTFIKTLCKSADINFYISPGLKDCTKDYQWIEQFKKEIALSETKNVTILPYFTSLSNILEYLLEKNVTIGITSDTSISHLLIKASIVNFTIFRMQFWNLTTIQTVCEVFARESAYQLPVILNEDSDMNDLCANLAEGIFAISNDNISVSGYCRSLNDSLTQMINHWKRCLDLNDHVYFKNIAMAQIAREIEDIDKAAQKFLIQTGNSWVFNLYDKSHIVNNIAMQHNSEYLQFYFWSISPWLKLIRLMSSHIDAREKCS